MSEKAVKVNEENVKVSTRTVEEVEAEKEQLIKALEELQGKYAKVCELYNVVVEKYLNV